MINFQVEIYNYKTKAYEIKPSAVFTPKFANLLDEQLDEATITLKGDLTAYYQPLTKVKITITNKPDCKLTQSQYTAIMQGAEQLGLGYNYDATNKTMRETQIVYMFIANDRGIETPVGSGRYNHELYLIERTKLLERYICESLTFTNPLGNNYLEAQTLSYPVDEKLYGYNLVPNIDDLTYSSYLTPLNQNDTFTVLSLNSVASKIINYLATVNDRTNGQVENYNEINGQNIYSKIEIDNNGTISTIGGYSGFYNFNETKTITPRNGVKVTYTINISSTDSGGNTSIYTYRFYYYFYAINNRLPLKKWTITDVINRVFDLVEPLEVPATQGGITEQPKFRLNPTQAIKLDKILSPEFSFTQSTLREVLQQIGGYIHGEPRITSEITENGKSIFYVSFDMYGSNEYSKIADQPYITATFGTDINQYCTALDSNAENLTNTLDWAQGVILEPFDAGYKSLRTESTTVRLQEDNSSIISTQFPIARLQKVICRYIPYIGEGEWDITPYIFESTAYTSELSSYEGSYPFSKAYGIYYTMGQKNIQGLFFKAEHAVSPVFHNYAIVNILRAVTGRNGLEIDGQDLMRLSFSVSYMPLYSARVKTYKQLILDGFNSTLVYNQGANAIETRYYGEHLKGAVERLGNVEKTYTYKLAFLSQIPKVGTRFDNHYYISNVSYELFPTYIKCTVGLSKNFNRKSQYVGINSQKRMWEISERQTQSRQTVYEKFIVVSEEAQDKEYLYVPLASPVEILFDKDLQTVNLAIVKTYDINNNPLLGEANQCLFLPVISSAIGNSLTFTYNLEDNYSAGQKITYIQGDDSVNLDENNVTGYWGANVPYTDYYGRVYYWEDYLVRKLLTLTESEKEDLSQSLPQSTTDKFWTGGYLLNTKHKYRKDSREIPQITHQITVVTDSDSIIIGSALCANCACVNNTPKTSSVYLFKDNLNVIDGKVDFTNATKSNAGSIIHFDTNTIELKQATITGDYKAWALVTEATEKVIEVEAEDGTQTTQTIYEGGEILIGQNNFDLTKGSKTLYFTTKRKIND